MTSLTEKYKPYPAYKPSGVEWLGEVPAHWEVRRLKYSAPFANSKLDNKPEEALYVGLENIEQWTGELLLDYQPDSVDGTVVTFAPGDVLFGKLRPYLAKVARPEFEGTATSEVLVMRPLDECSQDYLAYCLLNALYIRWIDTLTYGAKMPRVSPDEVACSFIPFPPLPEQQAIAAFLDRETARIDALVSSKERLIELLQEKRTALITRAVTRGLDPNAPLKPSGVEWLGEVPAHWEVRRLKYSAPFANSKLDNKPEEALYVGLENIEQWTGELLLDYQPDSVDGTVVTFAPGDVLFGKLRPYLAKVARPEFEGTATSEVLVMRPLDECSQDYLAYCLLNALYIRWIDTLTYGAKMPRVSPDEVACSFIPFPPLPEQQAIAAFLDRETAKLDGLVGKVREAIERLNELRSALVSAAVTGRIDVREEAGCK